MFCRYCGKTIADDSDFCSYCGKSLGTGNLASKPAEASQKKKPEKTYDYTTLDFFMTALCYIALGVFLFFNIKMAPFYGIWKDIAYVVEAAIAIFTASLARYHELLRGQLAQPMQRFCQREFEAEFIAEALLTWTVAGEGFEEIYFVLEKIFDKEK